MGKERGFKEGKCPALSCACCRPVPEPRGSQACAIRSPERMGKRRQGSSSLGQRMVGTGDHPCGWLSSHRRAAAELPGAWQRWFPRINDPKPVPHSIRRAGGQAQAPFPKHGWGAAVPAAGSYCTEHGGCKGWVSRQQEGWSRSPAACPHPQHGCC